MVLATIVTTHIMVPTQAAVTVLAVTANKAGTNIPVFPVVGGGGTSMVACSKGLAQDVELYVAAVLHTQIPRHWHTVRVQVTAPYHGDTCCMVHTAAFRTIRYLIILALSNYYICKKGLLAVHSLCSGSVNLFTSLVHRHVTQP